VLDAMTERPAYPGKARMAVELDCAESTVDELVKRGVLPPPIKLSTGCVRWCWADVETALASLKDAQKLPDSGISDPYLRGVRNVTQIQEGRRGAS
jgi:predicted DNA-binding transcriptional regulator AlpA